MAGRKRITSLTDSVVSDFSNTSTYPEQKHCDHISGFFLFRNHKSVAFRFRSGTGKKRSPITIGLADKMTSNKAAQIALEMIELINSGDDPKDALRKPSDAKTNRIVSIPDNDLSYLGNFFNQVYVPHVTKEEWGSAQNNINAINLEFSHLFSKKMSDLTAHDIELWQDTIEERLVNGRSLAYDSIKRKYDTLLGVIRLAIEVSNKPKGQHAGLLYESPFKIRALRGASKTQKTEYEKRSKEMDKLNRRIMEDSELEAIEKAMLAFGKDLAEARGRSRQHSARQHLPDLLAKNFPHWVIPFIYLCYYTGLRPNDILDLRWEDFYNGKVTITANKSKRYNEPVIIRQEVADVKRLFKYSCKEVLDLWQADNGMPSTGWVFPSDNDSKKRLGRDGYRKAWTSILKLADMNLHVYSFRHHFISYQLSTGTDKLAVAALVGHKTTKMIDEHYSHHLPSKATDALRKM